jgi:hypothetical protein
MSRDTCELCPELRHCRGHQVMCVLLRLMPDIVSADGWLRLILATPSMIAHHCVGQLAGNVPVGIAAELPQRACRRVVHGPTRQGHRSRATNRDWHIGGQAHPEQLRCEWRTAHVARAHEQHAERHTGDYGRRFRRWCSRSGRCSSASHPGRWSRPCGRPSSALAYPGGATARGAHCGGRQSRGFPPVRFNRPTAARRR